MAVKNTNLRDNWSMYPRQLPYLGLTSAERDVLVVLLMYSSLPHHRRGKDFMVAWMSIETIRAAANISSRRTVQNAIVTLKERGLIEVEYRGDQHLTSRYLLEGLQARMDELAPLCEVQGHRAVASACRKCKLLADGLPIPPDLEDD
jgi:hypothetical protein